MSDTQEKRMYAITAMDDVSAGFVEGAWEGKRFNGCSKRIVNYTAHKNYQAEVMNKDSPNYIDKVGAGPLESEDGANMIGSFLLVHSTRAEAEAFVASDPFTAAGTWSSVTINRWQPMASMKTVEVTKDGADLTTIRCKTTDV